MPIPTTLLTISVLGVPIYSARGVTQTLDIIEAASVQRRTVNGDLIDLSYAPFRKYKTTITCTDQRSPSTDSIFPGLVVQIGCVAELGFPVGGTPNRPVVPGSEYTEANFTYYRPLLTMMIKSPGIQKVEWQGSVGWTLPAEEV
jgi:hypothetical protein